MSNDLSRLRDLAQSRGESYIVLSEIIHEQARRARSSGEAIKTLFPKRAEEIFQAAHGIDQAATLVCNGWQRQPEVTRRWKQFRQDHRWLERQKIPKEPTGEFLRDYWEDEMLRAKELILQADAGSDIWWD